MVGPGVSAGVKERDEGRGLDVASREIRALTSVASVAGQGEVLQVVGTAVLLRDDMLNVMGKSGLLLAEETVFAAVS